MKVSFIIKSHLRDDEEALIGGASKNPYRLIKYLKQLVTVPIVVYFTGSHSDLESYKAIRCRVRILKLYAKTLMQNVLCSAAVWKAFARSDVVQCHHPHYGLTAALLKRFVFRRVHFVVKAHGTALPELNANKYSGLKGWILNSNARLHLWHDRFVLAHADVVLCSSEFQRQEMASIYGIAPSATRCIYNGYDPEPLSNALDSCMPGSTGTAVKFVFCGRVVPKKGIVYAISLFKAVAGTSDGFELRLILGKQQEIEDLSLYQEIRRHCAADPRIQIEHDLGESELYRAFCTGSVGLITSENYESIPTVIIEMLAAGLPVFATYAWGVPELLPEAFGLSKNLEMDSSRIRRYLADRIRDDSAKIGFKFVQDQFAYPALARRYVALYEELCAAHQKLASE